MTERSKPESPLLLNGEPYEDKGKCDQRHRCGSRWKKRVLIGVLALESLFALPKLAHGQFLSVFDAIFSSIQNDIGTSLKAINQVAQQIAYSGRCGPVIPLDVGH